LEQESMDHYRLLETTEFNDGSEHGHAVALHPSGNSRTLLFALRDGQTIKKHSVESPMHIVVLSGRGQFIVGGQTNVDARECSLLVLDAEETIEGSAVGGDLVFLEVLHGTQT
jgi:hypothetical protein